MESKFNIQGKIAKLNAAKIELPKLLAQTGQTYFQLNFNKQQWDGQAWAPRKDNYYGRMMAGKAILLGKTGDLKRAMQDTIVSFDGSKIVWGVKDVAYAGFINEGTDNMPKRQIMGLDEGLMKKVREKIESEFKKVME